MYYNIHIEIGTHTLKQNKLSKLSLNLLNI